MNDMAHTMFTLEVDSETAEPDRCQLAYHGEILEFEDDDPGGPRIHSRPYSSSRSNCVSIAQLRSFHQGVPNEASCLVSHQCRASRSKVHSIFVEILML
jgi:hypothetical protein